MFKKEKGKREKKEKKEDKKKRKRGKEKRKKEKKRLENTVVARNSASLFGRIQLQIITLIIS